MELLKFLPFSYHNQFHFRNFGAEATQRSVNVHLSFHRKCSFWKIQMEHGQSSHSRGALIVLEGLDRSGKTSQSSRLLSYLKGLGFSAESWHFPDRNTGVGLMISSYLSNQSHLDDHAIHLLFSANRWEKKFVLILLETFWFKNSCYVSVVQCS